MQPLRLSLPEARRLAVRAQLLDVDRPALVAEVIDELTVLNIDPTNAIAPSEDLILWSRLGSGYEHHQLQEAVETERAAF